MTDESIRLNPFVYISETDVRFYLLVLIGIVVPSVWVLNFGIVIFSAMLGAKNTFFLRLFIVIFITSFIPLLIYWTYKKYPQKIIKKSKLKVFDKERFPDHFEYIEKLNEKYWSTREHLTLMYQPLDFSESAFTFGTRNHMYVGIPGGLIKKFRENIDGFRSIFLHELGHIFNRDVEKAYLADSAWRSLRLTLSIPLGIVVIYIIFMNFLALFFAFITGYDVKSLIPMMNLGRDVLVIIAPSFYVLTLLAVIYILRNQIIRLREFYADAKVLEWEESPNDILKTLEETGEEEYSQFEILTKFHPNIKERIQVLKNNTILFIPSLWVAFTVGYFYNLLEINLTELKSRLLAGDPYEGLIGYETGLRFFISIFIFTILMLAVSTSFHKSILNNIFIKKSGYFSTETIITIIKFSLAFSLGTSTDYILQLIEQLILSPLGRNPYSDDVLASLNLPKSIIGSLSILAHWVTFQALYIFLVLSFLIIFATISIRRSFSKKEADKNFLIITIFSSSLYVVNRYVADELLHNESLMIVFFLIFSLIAYSFIRMKNRKLSCPNCDHKISDFSSIKLNCPKCHRNLYSWAIYPFSIE